jgi:hypothetical protein
MRHISNEVTLHFTPDGIRIGELAATNTLFVSVLLESDKFEDYKPGGAVLVCTKTVHSVLRAITKQISSGDQTLKMEVASGVLELSLFYDKEERDTQYQLPCVVIDTATAETHRANSRQYQKLLMDRSSFGATLYMSARHLSHLVAHVFPLGDVVRVTCSAKEVVFEINNAHSDIKTSRVAFATQSRGISNAQEYKRIDCYFGQSMLCMLLRAMSLHSTTTLLLPNCTPGPTNPPAMMQANVSDLGTMSVAIAQIDKDAGP